MNNQEQNYIEVRRTFAGFKPGIIDMVYEHNISPFGT
jgi:hypothetical protein